MAKTADDSKKPASAGDRVSLLKRIATKSLQARGDNGDAALAHDGNNASIVLDEQLALETPWTPKSLGRAKTAIIYKVRTAASGFTG